MILLFIITFEWFCFILAALVSIVAIAAFTNIPRNEDERETESAGVVNTCEIFHVAFISKNITSCKHQWHLERCSDMLYQHKCRFGETEGYHELRQLFNEKRDELIVPMQELTI